MQKWMTEPILDINIYTNGNILIIGSKTLMLMSVYANPGN